MTGSNQSNDDLAKLVDATFDRWGRIDVLINSAGHGPRAPIVELTDEDWRNRERWDEYVGAVNDMVHYTSTARAPWTLVEGNDKYFARLKVVRTVCERLEQALGQN